MGDGRQSSSTVVTRELQVWIDYNTVKRGPVMRESDVSPEGQR